MFINYWILTSLIAETFIIGQYNVLMNRVWMRGFISLITTIDSGFQNISGVIIVIVTADSQLCNSVRPKVGST